MWDIRSETAVRSWKSTNTKENERTLSKPSPICSWFFTMGLANVPLAKTVLSGDLCVFPKTKMASGKTGDVLLIASWKPWNFS